MGPDSHDESEHIFDEYAHPHPGVFYTVTRIPGKGFPESNFECVESRCECPGAECTVENNCSCLKYGANYERSPEGGQLLLVGEKLGNAPIFECNFQCVCFGDVKAVRGDSNLRTITGLCPNRNVQFGPADRLEVFEAGGKGWGLRTNKRLPAGSFVCEYAGEVIGLEEAKARQKANREGMNYIFVLKEFTGNNLSGVTCVDPTHVGNIGRYINHSCRPNSAIVPVRVNDVVPWLCVFAVRDIDEGEEICYDYAGANEHFTAGGSRLGRKPCFCNSVGCKKFLPYEVEI